MLRIYAISSDYMEMFGGTAEINTMDLRLDGQVLH